MGVIRAIIAAGCVGSLLAGCETAVPLAVDTPLEATASYTGTDCFFEVSKSAGRRNFSPVIFEFLDATGDDVHKSCAQRQTDDAPLFPGLHLRPGYALEITALDAGQKLQASRSGRHSQSTIPHVTVLPVRRISPVDDAGRLTTLEEGVLLAALTTRRLLCFSERGGCSSQRLGRRVRTFFDTNAVDLWNALVHSARLIPIDRALYTHTAAAPGHAGVRWGLFISFRRVCKDLIAAKTDLTKAEKDKLAKTFTGFYGRKTPCDGASDNYYLVPRYLVSGPNALVLAAIVNREFTDINEENEGFLGKPVMARYSSLAVRPQAITPHNPGPAKDWTLDEWEWSGICDPRARVRRPDEQQRLAIRAFVPRRGYPVIRLLPPGATDGAATFDLAEVADDSRDDAFTRHRTLRLRSGRPALDGHSPTLARAALQQLYLDDVAALVWHRTTVDGDWAGASDVPPAGCNFGQIRGSW